MASADTPSAQSGPIEAAGAGTAPAEVTAFEPDPADGRSGGGAPQPPSAYLQELLASLPAALLVVDAGGTVRYGAGQLDRVGGRHYGDLLGTSVTEHLVAPDHRGLLEELITGAADLPDNEMTGPLPLSFLDSHGAEILTEAWAVNRTGEDGVKGIALLLMPETAYGRFENVLMAVALEGVPVEQAYGAFASALRHPPVLGEAYFLVPGESDRATLRTPDLEGVPGPPLEGPWDEIWAGDAAVEVEDLATLTGPLGEAARAAGYRSVACFAVRSRSASRAEACLVVWNRTGQKMTPVARVAVDRALVMASLVRAHHFAEEGMADSVLRDPLTGLGNSKALSQSLEGHVEAGEQPAILHLDLDGFEQVTDGLGRLAGDAVLRVTARRLASVMRPTDELARIGADEFAVLCNGRPSRDQMVVIANRVITQLSRPLSVGNGVTADVGVSIGIALDFPVGTPVDQILAHATGALDAAKAKGRNQWSVARTEG